MASLPSCNSGLGSRAELAEPVPADLPVKRAAFDGRLYSKNEFLDYYGSSAGAVIWEEAGADPARCAPRSNVVEPAASVRHREPATYSAQRGQALGIIAFWSNLWVCLTEDWQLIFPYSKCLNHDPTIALHDAETRKWAQATGLKVKQLELLCEPFTHIHEPVKLMAAANAYFHVARYIPVGDDLPCRENGTLVCNNIVDDKVGELVRKTLWMPVELAYGRLYNKRDRELLLRAFFHLCQPTVYFMTNNPKTLLKVKNKLYSSSAVLECAEESKTGQKEEQET